MGSRSRPQGCAEDQEVRELYVCLCQAIKDTEIREAILKGARTLEELIEVTGAGTGCMSCLSVLQDMLPADGGGVAKTEAQPEGLSGYRTASDGGDG
jgi:bacterioferritin-associated ferredoxin